jgi:hypothetical protein
VIITSTPALSLAYRNLKNIRRILKNEGGECPKVGTPQNNTYIEFCATENLGGKIQFLI